MKYVQVLWKDGTGSEVTLEHHIKALIEQNLSAAATQQELEKQMRFNPAVVGVAKFKNGNICFAADGTWQATIFPGGRKMSGKYRSTQPD